MKLSWEQRGWPAQGALSQGKATGFLVRGWGIWATHPSGAMALCPQPLVLLLGGKEDAIPLVMGMAGRV